MYTELILHWAGRAARGLLDISVLTPPLLLKEDGKYRLPSRPSLYIALRRRRVVYCLAVDTKGITTVARNSPIAFGWCKKGETANAACEDETLRARWAGSKG